MKGDSPVKNTGNELWVYSAQFSCWLQVEGLWEAKHRSIWPRSWFTRSDWPLVCGWMVSLQKCDTNWGFLLETTSSGRPWILKMWSMITQAVSLAEGSLGRATKWTALEKRSTTVRITVLPLDRGRPVTKTRDGKEWEGDVTDQRMVNWKTYSEHRPSKHPRTDGCPQSWQATKTAGKWQPVTSSLPDGTESGRMTPLENGSVDWIRNKKQTAASSVGNFDSSQGSFDAILNSPCDRSHYTALRQNSVRRRHMEKPKTKAKTKTDKREIKPESWQ